MNPRTSTRAAEESMETPVGRLTLRATAHGLTHVQVDGSKKIPHDAPDPHPDALGHLDAALRALDEYFLGQSKSFDELTLAPAGTSFQLRVWQELLRIPYGETKSYGRLAHQIGRPSASRAVGMANGRNPIGVIIPCHRVIGADGSLTGYGGGLPMKEWLLHHEGALLVGPGARAAARHPPSFA